MNALHERIDARVTRIWTIVTVACVLALCALGFRNLRTTGSRDVPDAAYPEAIEPEGDLESPPTSFRWVSGHPGAVAQLVIHYSDGEILWTSEPLVDASEAVVPREIWRGIGAGKVFFWRVRQAVDGRPSGSSRYVRFSFRADLDGYAPGKAPATFQYLQ